MATATRKKKKPSKKALPSGKGLTYEKVWALMRENAEKDAERTKELKLLMDYTDRRIKETDRIVRRNSKQMGDLHQRFGQLAEQSGDTMKIDMPDGFVPREW